MTNSTSALKNAFLQGSINPDGGKIAVRAEDAQVGSGIDFSKHFFEPQVGATYLIKFLQNPGGELITHRSVYKNLPDPERRGKTFHYVSSGNSKTCKALELFFELNALKKDGNAIASSKIEKYLGKTNQGCAKIQILQSPKQEEVGMVRLFNFATFGPNATVTNLIDLKLNPTAEQIKQGYEQEDIFDIFESSVLSLVVTEATYDGVKGRDFTKSSWAPKKRGAIAKLETGETHEFTKADIIDGGIAPAIEPFFESFVNVVMHEDYDVYKYFAYKPANDPRNDKDTNDYIVSVMKKVDEIIPVIREKSLAEIAVYGKAATTTDANKPDAAKNIMAQSVPDELANSIMGENTTTTTVEKTTVENDAPSTESASEIEDILKS